MSIMATYTGNARVSRVGAASLVRRSVVEKLDALLWVNINVLDRFSEEFNIQLAWLRDSPPSSVDLGLSFGHQIKQLQKLLKAGEQSGEIRVEDGSARLRAMSLYELIFTPENVIRHAGPPAAHALAHATVLRGAIAPS